MEFNAAIKGAADFENKALISPCKDDTSCFFVDDEKFYVSGVKIAIEIYLRPKVTKGGIIMADGMRSRDIIDSPVGRVIAIGPDAYKESVIARPYCKIGDWVMYPRAAITRLNWENKTK